MCGGTKPTKRQSSSTVRPLRWDPASTKLFRAFGPLLK
ncbi:hypothetical protein CCHR01_00941 [Colletotrichum chrysophilum]|uniref:Uncharacterized protein n=1 Tax=Colletotrichum chrysophilum TaxID=1836956 RepID=A0AAD9AZX5_9PEZI|nr:hypothetical protein CCHR01_00941 [Colletotrichum chrysophilum]